MTHPSNQNDEPEFMAHRRKEDEQSQSVECHLRNVGNLSSSFARKLGMSEFGEIAGLLHDVGKVSDQFQNYIKSAVGLLNPDVDEEYVEAADLKGTIDHSTSGAQWIWNNLRESDVVTAQAMALCIASHHSGLIDCIGAGEANFGTETFLKRMRKADIKTNYSEVIEKIPSGVMRRCEELLGESSKTFIHRCKRIKQFNKGFEISICNQLGFLNRFLFSCLIDADRVDTSNFEFPYLEQLRSKSDAFDWRTCVGRLEASISKLKVEYEIDRARSAISDRCRDVAQGPQGTYTLSVPTGGGKTYSSLRFALHHAQKHKLEHVFYIVPYTSIIDQNAKAVRKILSDRKREFVLEVHSNLTPRKQSYRDKILAANWDAPIVFTTMVQFLESLFSGGTRGARRMHQLAKSVIVFDEIQSLPIKCVHLFNQAVNFLVEQCDSSVVLCTATQPLLHTVDSGKGQLHLGPDSEITEQTQRLYSNLKRTQVLNRTKPGGWSNSEIVELAIEQTNNTDSCLIVANTKKMARSIFEVIQSEVNDCETEVFHLSTSMCPAHRKAVLYLIKRRLASDAPVICVSTQLIEAGVDIDFGSAIRFLAGLDSIAQTAGRCNRNGIHESGNVFVVNPNEESLRGLAEIQSAVRCTERLFSDFAENPENYDHDLIGPKAMEWYYKIYFYSRAKEMDYPVPASKIGHDDSILNLLGENKLAFAESRRNAPESINICFRQAFMTAAKAFDVIDAPTEGVVVPYGRRGKELVGKLASAEFEHRPYKFLREAQQFTVNVFPNVLKKLQRNKAIHSLSDEFNIFHLDQQFYDQQFGLSTDPVSEMELLNA